MDRESRLSALLHLSSLDGAAASRIVSLVPEALGAFEAPDVAYVWLTSPNALLNGAVPYEVALNSDVDALKVRQLLRKIKVSSAT